MEFRNIKFKDIGTIITGTTPSTKNEQYYISNDYMFVGPSDLKTSKYIKQTEKSISNEAYNKYSNRFIDKNSICVDCIGSDMGNVAITSDKCLTNQQINSITEIDTNKFDYEYIYYILSTMKNYFHQIGQNGSTMPIINKSLFEDIEIQVPSIAIQRKIVSILSKLDEKIELNNQINNDLQDYLKTIYKASFQNKKNNSTLADIADCCLGGTPSRAISKYWNGNINWINSGEVNKFRIIKASEKITQDGLEHSSTKLLRKGTTVIAITGATLGQVSRLEIDSCANQSVVGIIPIDNKLNNYIYLNIFTNINKIISNQTGGAQQHINKNDIKNYKIYKPNLEEIQEFNKNTLPVFNKISINCFENETLEQLRDTLLPKLMNGEIDLDKIDI